MDKTVVELFAGVGGFRVGLNKIHKIDKNGIAIEKGPFDFVWFNQWEPSTKIQYAYECYKKRFNEKTNQSNNMDISLVEKNDIPNHTLLCGGFPCQDYSVARSLSKEEGIEGKKGVLWWEIYEILKVKKPPFVFLENVDRLLKSPSKQRGRDFGIMLFCFNKLGYSVEWRVINASEYGMPQKRKRIFIFASFKETKYYKKILSTEMHDFFLNKGIFQSNFPINYCDSFSNYKFQKSDKLLNVSDNFKFDFKNSGLMIDNNIYSINSVITETNFYPLGKILEKNVDDHYYLSDDKVEKFRVLRDKKKILRTSKNGIKYYYSEGSMSKYDFDDRPGRTMLTSEGTVNRSSHLIKDNNGYRILTPTECERLNMFPDGWTECIPERKRYFMMGNALVCGIIDKMSNSIEAIIENED